MMVELIIDHNFFLYRLYIMSISNIMTPNSYDLFSRSFNVQQFIADALEANNMNITGELIADRIQQNSGFNYLAPWDATKSYILNDLVISNNQIWRCLVANVNVVPDPNNPAQSQWVNVTSNNAILNERQYAQIHLTNGNNDKALVSAVPFQTVPACLEYLKTVNGGYAKIMTQGQNNIYGVGLFSGYDNITLDGGDNSDSYLSSPQNILDGYIVIVDCDNLVLKNVSMGRLTVAGDIGQFRNNKNFTFQNVTFIDPPDPLLNAYYRIFSDVGKTFGSHSFINCHVKPSNESSLSFSIYGECDPGTLILFDNSGSIMYSRLQISVGSFGGITTPQNFSLVVRNSYILSSIIHATDMNIILQNCIIKGSVVSAATGGSLTLINCSFLDPSDNTWGSLNLSGTAEYKLIDCFTNPNSNTDVINVAGNVNSLNYTMGPAARFNRLATWGAGIATSTGTTQAAVQVSPGALTTNLWSILTYNAGTGAITFGTTGFYQLLISLDVQNTATANEQCVINYWVGVSGSTESTALATGSDNRGFVGSAGILASYPSSRRAVPLLLNVSNAVTPYLFYVRSLSAAAYNVTISTMAVLQIR